MSIIDEVRSLIQHRLQELEKEQRRLQEALKSITGDSPRNGPGRPRGSRSAPQKGSRKGRRSRKGGTRADHALAFIKENPGATAARVSKELKIKPNYVYRVLGDLTTEGKLKKQGRTYSVAS